MSAPPPAASSSSTPAPKIAPIKLKLSLGSTTPATSASPPSNGTDYYHLTGMSVPMGAAKLKIRAPVDGAEAGPSSTPLSATATYTDSPVASSSTLTPSRQPKKRGRPRTRPSAIPPHLTPRPTVSFPSTAGSSTPLTPLRGDDAASSEPLAADGSHDDYDPISAPLSPADMEMQTPSGGASTYGDDEIATPTASGRRVAKWARIRRPFRELASKLLADLRRRDDYGLFLEPVDTDEYPDYLDRIGGMDKMMDLGTMQHKVDDREYRDFDALEADLKALVAAAHRYNPPGSVPHNAATRILQHGIKLIERSRPLVRTPSPSPTRISMTPDGSVRRGRETTAMTDDAPRGPGRTDVAPAQYIPEEMLAFPPNSLQARAVGWNLNGGRIVRLKRYYRGREKFVGKWREWDVDGSRNLAEMDEPADVLETWRTRRAEPRDIIDWKRMRAEGAWWDWDGPGGQTGQAPLPGQPRLRPNPLKTRALGPLDWGLMPDIDAELASFARAGSGSSSSSSTRGSPDLDVLAEHMRPMQPRSPRQPAGWPTQQFANVYAAKRPAADWLRDTLYGGPKGEAYVRSVDSFLRGALGDGDDARWACARVLSPLEGPEVDAVRSTLGACAALDKPVSAPPSPLDKPAILATARAAHAHAVLAFINSPLNPLDLQPLLRAPADFTHVGKGVRAGAEGALRAVGDDIAERAARVAAAHGTKRPAEAEAGGDAKRASTDAGALVPAPVTATHAVQAVESDEDKEDAMRRIRLELVALAKFYPLAALCKMSKADAERLLPANVRALMTRQ
ncbi:hypothetical protein Q5752_000425 [Cryptotrichosporon argae]